MAIIKYSENVKPDESLNKVETYDFTSDEMFGFEQDEEMKIALASEFADAAVARNTIDNLTSTDTDKALSANQGKILKDAQDVLNGDIATLETVVDTNRLYSDSQYLELKAKADSLQVKCNTLQAEVYTDDPILQYGATEIIGDGYEADDTPIDVSANVVDGKLALEQKGLTITNLVDGADIADSGTVSFNTVNGDKYFDTLNETIITGDGTEMSATNSSGATANMAIYHLNALGLDHITDTDLLAKLLPYVDGTKNVGKMGLKVMGRNLFDASRVPTITDTGSGSVTIWNEGDIVRIKGRTGSQGRIFIIGGGYEGKLSTGASASTLSYITGAGTFKYKEHIAIINPTRVYYDGGYSNLGPSTIITVTKGIQGFGYYFDGGSNIDLSLKIQLNLGSTALPYEPYQEQLTFLPAIGNSLPNGVADSIKTVADGWEHTKRVERVDMSTLNWQAYATVETADYWGVRIVKANEPDLVDFRTETGGNLRIANAFTTYPLLDTWSNSFATYQLNNDDNLGYVDGIYLQVKIPKSEIVGTIDTAKAKAYFASYNSELRWVLPSPITTHYDLPIPTSGKTIHRFAGEEKIALYGTGLTFSENVLSVLSAVKFVAGVMTDITDLATITDDTVTFSGVSATDVVYVKVEHDVDRPLGVLEHTPAVSNTASRLAELEGAYEIITDAGVQYTQFN